MSESKEKRSPFSDGPASPDIPLPCVCTTIKTTVTLDGLELELLKGYKSEIVTIAKLFQVENKFSKYGDGSVHFQSKILTTSRTGVLGGVFDVPSTTLLSLLLPYLNIAVDITHERRSEPRKSSERNS